MKKDEAEAEFTRQLCEVGITCWYVAYKYGHFYYAFDLKDGSQHYWTDIRESNLRKILKASGIRCRDDLAEDIHPKRRDASDGNGTCPNPIGHCPNRGGDAS